MKKILIGQEEMSEFSKIETDEEINEIDNILFKAYDELGNAMPNWSAMQLYTSGRIFNEPGFAKMINNETGLTLCTIKESKSGVIHSVLPLPTKYVETILKHTLNERIHGLGGSGVLNINKIEFEVLE